MIKVELHAVVTPDDDAECAEVMFFAIGQRYPSADIKYLDTGLVECPCKTDAWIVYSASGSPESQTKLMRLVKAELENRGYDADPDFKWLRSTAGEKE